MKQIVTLATFFLFFFSTGEAWPKTEVSDPVIPQEVFQNTSIDIYDKTPGTISGPPAPRPSYPGGYSGKTLSFFNGVDHRVLLWIFIQQHFFLGSFILGLPMIAWMLELFGHFRRKQHPEESERQDALAKEIMRIGLPFYPWTVFLGVVLTGAFLLLYSEFFQYMSQLFRPIIFLYALCFFLESLLLYGYVYTWGRWGQGYRKWYHISLGALLVTNGALIIALANAWMSFMMSPTGVDAKGRYLGNILRVVQTPFWSPLNVHRILASIMFSGAVLAAYAAYQFLRSSDPKVRAHYDWMGHVTSMIAITNLFLLPFAGYWFAKVVFIFRQRMGMTLMGGEMSWPFVIQAMLIGLIFMTVTHYLWKGTERMQGSERYTYLAKYLLVILCVSFMIWTTPHTVPASQGEFTAMGGGQHPVVGSYGTMAAKNTAINTMILAFGLCFLIFKRCNREIVVGWKRTGDIGMVALFVAAEMNIIALGVYGHFVPAKVRVGLALPQFVTAVTTLTAGAILNFRMLRGAKTLGPIRWGRLPVSGAISLFIFAVLITLTMALMGYIRSSVRLSWHITEIMADATPWASTLSLTDAISMILLNVAIFWAIATAIFWAGRVSRLTVVSGGVSEADRPTPQKTGAPIPS